MTAFIKIRNSLKIQLKPVEIHTKIQTLLYENMKEI